LIDLYTSSDIALVTPIRDGMNLVAKEYVATRVNQDGVLILSEMAGASNELDEAILINPNNFEELANALKNALEMPLEEQKKRMGILQKRLSRYTVEKWAKEFMKSLNSTLKEDTDNAVQKMNPTNQDSMLNDYNKSQKRLLFLDYDGTLAGFKNNPQDAKPDAELITLLDQLNEKQNTDFVIVSGRDRETFEQWFNHKSYSLITDHGVWLKDKNEDWKMLERLKTDWMDNILPILESFVDRTPGTFIEKKKYSLAWHYRKADPELAMKRAMELNTVLTSMTSNNDLKVLKGNKVMEIKSSSVNKGRATSRWLTKGPYDFIFAIGDDWTDEYMFDELPNKAYTVKVGSKKTKARYYVKDTENVRELLSRFV
ncbi:MAG: trehalose-phosphatase, partial [Mangrovimonas sp.]|nr:trehalose-phosphatase [Mangrovimonas sp.]